MGEKQIGKNRRAEPARIRQRYFTGKYSINEIAAEYIYFKLHGKLDA